MDLAAAVHAAIEAAALFLEAAAAVTILAGLVLVAFRLRQGVTPARRSFADVVLLALDLTIAADVLKLASVDWDGLLVIGGVVLVRILLTLTIVLEVHMDARRTRAKA